MLPGAKYRAPLFSWRYVIAPTDIEFIDSTRFGADLDGDMLVGTVLTGMILRLDINADRSDFALSGALEDRVDDNDSPGSIKELGDASIFGRGFGVVTHIASAPDGCDLGVLDLEQRPVPHHPELIHGGQHHARTSSIDLARSDLVRHRQHSRAALHGHGGQGHRLPPAPRA
jgi:hypothetical protein